MIDPYGDDLADLSVMTFVEGTLETCDVIMNSKKGPLKMIQPLASSSVSIATVSASLT